MENQKMKEKVSEALTNIAHNRYHDLLKNNPPPFTLDEQSFICGYVVGHLDFVERIADVANSVEIHFIEEMSEDIREYNL